MSTAMPIRAAFLDDHLSFGGSTINLIRLLPGLNARGIATCVVASDADNAMGEEFRRQGVELRAYPFGTKWWLYDDRIRGAYQALAAWSPAVVVASHESISFDLLRYVPPGVFRIAVVRNDDDWSYRLIRTHAPWIDAAVGGTARICRGIRSAAGSGSIPVCRIPNGAVPPLEFPLRSLDAGILKVVYIGRLAEEQKRVSRFVSIWQEVRRRDLCVDWTFIGDGPARAWLESRMPSSACQTVHFAGQVPQDEVSRRCRRADVVVLVSDYEGLTIGVLEGMAEGLVPVVTTQHGECPDMIDPTCGCCVPPDNPAAFVDVLAQLAADSGWREGMQRAAYDKICRELHFDRNIAAWESLIREHAPSAEPLWPAWRRFLGPQGSPPDFPTRRLYYSAPLRPARRLAHMIHVGMVRPLFFSMVRPPGSHAGQRRNPSHE